MHHPSFARAMLIVDFVGVVRGSRSAFLQEETFSCRKMQLSRGTPQENAANSRMVAEPKNHKSYGRFGGGVSSLATPQYAAGPIRATDGSACTCSCSCAASLWPPLWPDLFLLAFFGFPSSFHYKDFPFFFGSIFPFSLGIVGFRKRAQIIVILVVFLCFPKIWKRMSRRL